MNAPQTGAALPGWEHARDCTVSMLMANILGVLFVVPGVAILAGAYAAIWNWSSLGAGFDAVNLWAIPALLPAIALHEAIHGVTWAWFSGKSFRVVRSMTAAASGDMLIAWLLRGAGHRSLVLDHPIRAGCWVLDDPASAGR